MGIIVFLLVAWTARVAWRNFRSGRGDVRTAAHVALAVAGVRLLHILGDHRFSIGAGLEALFGHLVYATWGFCFLWVFSMALEPLARRFWPQMLTSWVRLFNGRSRDPLVGRDLLVGVLAGLLMLVMNWLVLWALPQLLNVAPMLPNWSDSAGLALLGGRRLIGAAAVAVNNASAALFIPVMIVALTRVPVRRTWLAIGLCLLFFVVALMPTMASPVPHLIGTSLFFGLFFFVLFRFGFLACAAAMLTMHLAHDLPITPDTSSWFFSSTIFILGLIAALALYGFKVALPRRATVRGGS